MQAKIVLRGGGIMSCVYEVGYGKPPVHTRFRKGQSGNPRGRPRGTKAGRLEAIILKEAYRYVRVKEGDSIERVPAIQVMVRAMFTHGARGNGPTQRAFIEVARQSEHGLVARAVAAAKDQAAEHPRSPL